MRTTKGCKVHCTATRRGGSVSFARDGNSFRLLLNLAGAMPRVYELDGEQFAEIADDVAQLFGSNARTTEPAPKKAAKKAVAKKAAKK